MSETKKTGASGADEAAAVERRAALKRIGRYAAVTAPAVTLLLAVMGKPSKAVAASVA